ncbi:hypothetical protein MF406_14315 [Georgenia sp. TF02-10]|uniref:hypothetical protein n=1 Tax=Georgenia sp. TF02-10 TaxID=2917725 RepID=UPI001FA6F393|nr:hypothetical protein [Georgenia sp. TF02-10]UNX54106.1 hypothetical protein MF406_14315 [Georgenia sp. TF02-10]
MTSDTDTRWMLQALHDLAGRIRARARETADQELEDYAWQIEDILGPDRLGTPGGGA